MDEPGPYTVDTSRKPLAIDETRPPNGILRLALSVGEERVYAQLPLPESYAVSLFLNIRVRHLFLNVK